VLGSVRERGTKFTELESDVQAAKAIEQIMETDGDRFIQILAQTDPEKYGKFAKLLEQGETPAAAAAAVVSGDEAEPEPDYDMGDGRKTYSLDGMRKRDEFRDQRLTKNLTAEFQRQLKEALAPYEGDRKARETETRRKALAEKTQESIDRTLDRASKWPGFLDHQDTIAKLITDNPKLDIVDAYMQVVPVKFQADRTKMRQELIDEANALASSTSVAVSSAATVKPAGKIKSTADFAREEIQRFST
jgi:hypothetical protein